MKKFLKVKQLFLLLLFITFVPLKTHAEELTTFNTSNYSKENIVVSFRESEIIFSKFPDREDFNYVMISLYSENGTTYNKEFCSTESSITYPIGGVPNGYYFIQVYKSPTRNGRYWSYFYKENGIKIKIDNGMITPIQSAVYEHNISLYNSYKSDKVTTQYYLQPSYGVQSDNTEISTFAKSLVLDTDNNYEKVKKIHDWVANNIWYNYDGYYNGHYGETDAVGVLHSKKSVCQGYANLTAALLRSLGIPTKVVSGYALGISTNGSWSSDTIHSDETNHAWNEAYVDNRWVIIDTTWDSDNRYQSGQFSQDTSLTDCRYFDPTIEFFSYDHKISDQSAEVVDYEKYLKSITLKTKSTTLYLNGTKGSAKQLDLDINYDKLDGMDWKIRYSSSNPKIATVSKDGKIEAKKVGVATIKATIMIETFSKELSFKVTVKNANIQVTSSIKSMKVNTIRTLKVKLYGLKSVKWSSSNKSVATVSSTGKVVAKKAGSTTITVSSGRIKRYIRIKVVK